MKKFTTIITGLVLMLASLQSNASLIHLNVNQASYQAGETVTLDILIENVSLETDELYFDLNFDSLSLTFGSFNFSDDILSSTFWAFDPTVIAGKLDIFVIWDTNGDLPASSFSIGQASFTAQQAYDPAFNVTNAYLANQFQGDIGYPEFEMNIPVPEPNTSLIMLLGLAFLPLQRKFSSKHR